MDQKNAPKKQKPLLVPIKFMLPDNAIAQFATNMTVQTLEDEFKISFYQQSPPLGLDSNSQIPTEIPATFVSSVIVTAAKLPRFIKVLQGQLEKYTAIKKANK